jgi:hypothetical protein
MTPSFREILEVLNQRGVEHIVVGGVAAVIHGAPITTFDLSELIRQKKILGSPMDRAVADLLEGRCSVTTTKMISVRTSLPGHR